MGEEGDGSVYSVPDAAEAATLLGRLLRAGDVVLVKGSRGMGLERVAQALAAEPVGGDSRDRISPRPRSDEQNAIRRRRRRSDATGAAEWAAS